MSGAGAPRGKRAPLVLTSAMAATLGGLSGCSEPVDPWEANAIAAQDTAVCVDSQGYRVADYSCDNGSSVSGTRSSWYYVRRGSAVPYYGDSLYDSRLAVRGSTVPEAGRTYTRAPATANMTRSAAVSRGGFGSSGRGFGSGRS